MRPNPLTLAVIAALGLSIPARAFEPFVVKEIRVDGIQRTEAGTVYNYLPVKVGEKMDNDRARQAIKALFATGFYNDVRIESEGDVLVVSVDERPVIASIEIKGAKEFESDQLIKALKENGLAESRVFDRSMLDAAEQELKKQYFSRGKYSVKINTEVMRLERNRVAISFDISEGLVAKIRQINIVGNEKYPESELKDGFQLGLTNFWSWFSKNDQYSKPKMQDDMEKMRSWYMDRGFLEFNVSSQQVALSEDKKDIFLTVNLSEGQQYRVKSVKVAGELVVPEAELQSLIEIKAGELFNRTHIDEAVKRMTDRLGDEGYAFANINPVPEVDKEKNEVGFTFYIDPGRKVYVRRVNIMGNTHTRDEVVRREVRQLEGTMYSGWKIKRSKERLDLTGYFSDVNIETPSVADSNDMVDLNITVTERQTGSVQAGLGYSQFDGLTLTGSFSQTNIFGSGNIFELSANTNRYYKTASLSFTNPYATPDGVSRGFDIYRRNTMANTATLAAYASDAVGGGLRWNMPISEFESISASLSGERNTISLYSNSPASYVDFVKQYGDTTETLIGSLGWASDTRDSSIFPTRGTFRRVYTQAALPVGSMRFVKVGFQNQYFYPLNRNFTLYWNFQYDQGHGYSGKALPFYQVFTAGGFGTVRGYEDGTLGPKDQYGNAVGGALRLVNNFEVLMPMPGMKADKSTRLSAFLDAGQVWMENSKPRYTDLRYSAGIALQWTSPMGPMKFSLARALNALDGDKKQAFQFTLGKVF
ncbi:outer membrane protein assembly factor BamA [Burkholderiaceae bacterium DAT-1]|nr:outer membrane protein assembly factor BamA [Burkholderiaceae bacterium DAT-1]